MNKKMSIPSLLVLLFLLALVEGCKIEITVPEGGKVVSASHAYDCDSGETCVVEVNDFHFDETFDAHPWDGWVFIGWKIEPGYFCALNDNICHLSTKGFEEYDSLAAIVESDETFYLEPEFVKGTPYDEALASVPDKTLRACLDDVPPPRRYAQQVRNVGCSVSNKIGSVGGIEAFARIESLSLRGNDSLTDLQPLAKLSRLQNLKLWLRSSNLNVAALGELKLLDYLFLSIYPVDGSNPDLTEIGNLQSLRALTLQGRSPGLNVIASLVNLRELDLYVIWKFRSQISDIGPLAGMTKLESLSLNSNQISDIGPLAGMTKLESLSLNSNQISDIGPLAGMTKLESLSLNSNQISDIGPLAGMTKLESLSLNSNQISDIGPLAEIDSIKNLSLAGNSISDVSPLKQHYPLAQNFSSVVLDLSNNPIQSTGDALDGIRVSIVDLTDVPLSCEEYSRLGGLYDSRWILTIDSQLVSMLYHGSHYSYTPPPRCR